MKFARRKRSSPVITIVSLIDILIILLIFFIVTTTFKTQKPQVEIDLPEVKSAVAKETQTEPVILSIDKEGQLYLGEKQIAIAELGNAFKSLQDGQKTLAMRADEKVSYGRILEVLDALRLAGVTNLPAMTRDRQ